MTYFTVNRDDLTDGSVLFEVVTPSGERVASTTDEEFAQIACGALNRTLEICEESYLSFVVNHKE